MRGRSQTTLDLEQAILAIAKERKPVTVRGVAYALFAQEMIDSMAVNNTKRVSEVMTRMREEETLDWTWIVDDSRTPDYAQTSSDFASTLRDTIKWYRRDRWQDQSTVVEVWSEKGTVGGVLAPVLDEYGINFRVMKGFTSFTSVKQACVESCEHTKKAVVLYVGDWDPSGLFMNERDLPRRIKEYGGRWRIKRIALLKRDLRRLPGFDAITKSKDSRYRWFIDKYGHRCWELDAMNPNTLRARVQREIERYIDWPKWQRSSEIEEAEVESAKAFAVGWPGKKRP